MTKAVIINTGTELLLGNTVNSNASFIAAALAGMGVDVFKIIAVGDNLERVKDCFLEEYSRNQIIIFTGGLGGTVDDITKEAVSGALGIPVEKDPAIEEMIKQKYIAHGREYYPTKESQVIKGSRTLSNPLGSAPGYYLLHKGRSIILLPGVPHEMRAMFPEVMQILSSMIGDAPTIRSRIIHTLGMREMEINNRINDLFKESTNPTIALLASPGEVMIRLTSKDSPEKADDLIGKMQDRILERIGDCVWGYDDQTLEKVLGELLKERGLTIGGTESCTGGLVSKMLTDTPGSTSFFQGSSIVYTNEMKSSLLGVDPEVLQKYGAVSEETLLEMIKGAQNNIGSDICFAITGIAGPSGGTKGIPVGTVYAGFSFKGEVITQRYDFLGNREVIREQSARHLLFRILKEIRGN